MAIESSYPKNTHAPGVDSVNVGAWLSKIDQSERKMQRWRKNAQSIVERYRGKDEDDMARGFQMRTAGGNPVINLHWSNVQVLLATAYARTPKPEVARRQRTDADAAGQTMAEHVQKLLEFSVDQYDFDSMMEDTLIDFWNAALGQVRVRYKPYFRPVMRPAFDPASGAPILDAETGGQAQEPAFERVPLISVDDIADGSLKIKFQDPDGNIVDSEDVRLDPDGAYMDGAAIEEKAYEEVVAEYVPWDCFGWDTGARTWSQVTFAWIKHPMTKDDVARQFGKAIANSIPYQSVNPGDPSAPTDHEQVVERTDVYEVFDKQRRRCFSIVRGYPRALAVHDDPYRLEGFFPFPKPLWGTITSDKLIPVPFFQIVQDLYYELDEIQRRIMRLTAMVKVRGAFDAQRHATLSDILTKDDGYLAPLDQWTDQMQKEGVNGAIGLIDLGPIMAALQQLGIQRESTIQKIYEVTGLSDILRGATRASESAAAQKIKQEYVSARINREVRKIARFVRDVLRIMAEFIVEHFDKTTAEAICNAVISDEEWSGLRNDITRNYKIDVQTDTMMLGDEEAETERREKAVNSMATFLQAFVPAAQAGLLGPETVRAIMHYIASASSKGRDLEKFIATMQFPTPAPPATPAPPTDQMPT